MSRKSRLRYNTHIVTSGFVSVCLALLSLPFWFVFHLWLSDGNRTHARTFQKRYKLRCSLFHTKKKEALTFFFFVVLFLFFFFFVFPFFCSSQLLWWLTSSSVLACLTCFLSLFFYCQASRTALTPVQVRRWPRSEKLSAPTAATNEAANEQERQQQKKHCLSEKKREEKDNKVHLI